MAGASARTFRRVLSFRRILRLASAVQPKLPHKNRVNALLRESRVRRVLFSTTTCPVELDGGCNNLDHSWRNIHRAHVADSREL